MKTVLVSTFLVFQATSALAGLCSPLEYAELKDKPSKVLVAYYCNYDRYANYNYAKSDQYAAMAMNDRQFPSVRATYTELMQERTAEAEKCNDCKAKILRVLEDRSDYKLECEQK
jgi:hypothetical protein